MYINTGQGYARVCYCLKAVLGGVGTFSATNRALLPVQVMANSGELKEAKRVVQPRTAEISRLLLSKGDIDYGAKVLNTNLEPGKEVQVQIALVNNSRASLEEVQVQVQKVIQWSAHGQYRTAQQTISEATFPARHFTRCQKLGKVTMAKKLQETNRHKKNFNDILRALHETDETRGRRGNAGSWCRLPIPADTHETFRGTSTEISYNLQVTLKTKAGFSNPEFTVPLNIAAEQHDPSYDFVAAAVTMSRTAASCPIAFDVQPICQDQTPEEYRYIAPVSAVVEIPNGHSNSYPIAYASTQPMSTGYLELSVRPVSSCPCYQITV
ncbi:expressed unknown protein [Seminavis robusta]|uniref:Arrestin C-terminal-like domain-containing protein n=1 Tax=Seminavis robusta TaxID=568900 RepID=A0A9N8E0Q8_9STRA|nr:expressed unknown protein [Seminavis robusta]|eukprot:Sro504_g156040.1 n/a (325) ;mRNA; r:46281-47255